jgi:hypothetical protein
MADKLKHIGHLSFLGQEFVTLPGSLSSLRISIIRSPLSTRSGIGDCVSQSA